MFNSQSPFWILARLTQIIWTHPVYPVLNLKLSDVCTDPFETWVFVPNYGFHFSCIFFKPLFHLKVVLNQD